MNPNCHVEEPERLLCQASRHDGYHHARSMNEIQKALREDRRAYDPDGDWVASAKIKPKGNKNSPVAEGMFKLGAPKWSGAFSYQVDQILVEDEPFDEEEAMKTILASLAKTL